MLSQSRLFGILQAHRILEALDGFDPHWVGSSALDVHIEGSDIDICCNATPGLGVFLARLKAAFGKHRDFKAGLETFGEQASCVGSFRLEDTPIHIWGRAHPVEEHEYFRFFKVEQSFLRFGGEDLQTAIRQAKRGGLKTEAAFARVLQLDGEANETLLGLYTAPSTTYLELLKQSGFL